MRSVRVLLICAGASFAASPAFAPVHRLASAQSLAPIQNGSDARLEGDPSPASVADDSGVVRAELADEGVLSRPPLGPLTARATEDDYFSVPAMRVSCAAYPPSTRNPFLFLDEEVEGVDWAEIVANRAREGSGVETVTPSTSPVDPGAREIANREFHVASVRSAAASLRLSAVLVSKDGGAAILNGEVVNIGERVDGSDLTLVGVSSRGVELEAGGVRVELPLPAAPSRNRTSESDREIERDAPRGDEEDS